jgi:hypothetical protein
VVIASLLRRGFNELYMALTVSNRCVEDAQAETGKDRNLCGGERVIAVSPLFKMVYFLS